MTFDEQNILLFFVKIITYLNKNMDVCGDLQIYATRIRNIKNNNQLEKKEDDPIIEEPMPTISSIEEKIFDKKAYIEEIVSIIAKPFTAQKDSQGYLHNSAVIAVACGASPAHIHKYTFSEIQEKNGILTCPTCITGTKSTKLVRTTAEKTLGVPFLLADIKPEVIYNHPGYKISLVCGKKNGEHGQYKVECGEGSCRIFFPHNAGKMVIDAALWEGLSVCGVKFNENQLNEIKKLTPKDKLPAKPFLTRSKPNTDRLPITAEFAEEELKKHKNANKHLANMNANIISEVDSDKLCMRYYGNL